MLLPLTLKQTVTRTACFSMVCIALVSPIAHAHNKVVVVPLSDSPPVRIYYGSVTGDGELETGNIESASRTREGTYILETGFSTVGCALTVTKGSQGVGLSKLSGKINAMIPISSTLMYVRTYDDDFSLDDTDFHFTAICPR